MLPQLCLSAEPSGRRAHRGSGAARMVHHTPASDQHQEPAIIHAAQWEGVLVPVYFSLRKTDISAVSLLSDARRQSRL